MRQKTIQKWASMMLVFAMMLTLVSPFSAFAESTGETEEKVKVSEVVVDDVEESLEELVYNTVEIVTFNDFHGALAEDVREGRNAGMAKHITAARQLREENPHTIFLAAGDNYQGSATSNLMYGAPVSSMMKAMDVTASAVGNHEFDWGAELIQRWSEESDVAFLASNIYDDATNEPVEWAKPYMIIEENGIKIALIGLAHPDTAVLTKAEHVAGLSFKDPATYAQIWVDYLLEGKAEEGKPDVIIALTHIDSYQDSETGEITGNVRPIAENVKGLDAIISGHSHREVAGFINDVAIVQAGAYGRLLGKLSLVIEDGQVVEIIPSIDRLGVRKSDLIADADALTMYEEVEDEVRPILEKVIGEAGDDFNHGRAVPNVSPLGYWVAGVMRDATGAQVAIQNGGGLRRPLEKGVITMGDMYEIMPFDNALVVFELPGEDLWKAIDHGILNPNIGDGHFIGLSVVYDESLEWPNRLVSVTMEDGTPLEMDQYYTVVVNDFMFTGGDSYDFSRARNVNETYIPVRDVMVEAIESAGIIQPEEITIVQVLEVEEASVELEKYTVREGDVLWKIAEIYGITYEELAEYNGLLNPHLIRIGQILSIPVR